MASEIREGLGRDEKEVELGLKVPWREKCQLLIQDKVQSVGTLQRAHGAEAEALAVLALHMAWAVPEEGLVLPTLPARGAVIPALTGHGDKRQQGHVGAAL